PLVGPRPEQGWPAEPRPLASRGAPRRSEAFALAWWRLRTRCGRVVSPGILTQRHARFQTVAPDLSLQSLEERRDRPMPLHPAELGLGSQQPRYTPTP